MKLLPGIDLVGSGWLGFGLSDVNDCHVFLVHDAGEAVLIDAGCGGAPELIVELIAAAGVAPQSVTRVLLTHAHPDHAAGALGLAERLGAQVCASAEVAEVLRRGDEDASGLTGARRSGLYPPTVRLLPTPTQTLDDGETISVGRIALRAIATPGHAAGHLCYFAQLAGRRALFSGDLVFARGRVALQGTPDCDLRQLAASLRLAAALRPDVLLPAHETLVLRDASAHLAVAVAAFDRQEIPPPLLP